MKGLVVIASNLRPRKLAGLESNGMVMCATKDDKIELLRPPEGSFYLNYTLSYHYFLKKFHR